MKERSWQMFRNRSLWILLSSMLFLSVFASILPIAFAAAAPTVKVVPETIELGPGIVVGQEFTVVVVVENLLKLYGLDIQFGWDTFYLEYVSHSVAIPVEDYPGGVLHNPVLELKNEVNEAGVPNAEPGTLYWIAYSSMVPAVEFNGNGTVFTMTFRVKRQPYDQERYISLKFTSTDLARKDGAAIPHATQNGLVILDPRPVPLDVNIDIYPIYFRGEKAEFHILTSHWGVAVDLSEPMVATLYFNGSFFEDLTPYVEQVATGLYIISYEIPQTASSGTYTLVVEAKLYPHQGTNLKSFSISSTLTGWDAMLKSIEDGIMNIVIPDLKDIKVDLKAINATVVSIEDDVVLIKTDVGTIKSDVAAINPVVLNIEGDTATIKTDVGVIKGSVTAIQGDVAIIKTDVGYVKAKIMDLSTATPGTSPITYASLIVALIAAIAVVASVLLIRKEMK